MTTILEEENKKVTTSGGSSAVYLSRLAKEYIDKGDTVDYKLLLEGTDVKVVISKKVFNFLIGEIRKLVQEIDFKIDYDKVVGEDVEVFNAYKDNTALSYTRNLDQAASPISVTLSVMLSDIDHDIYKRVSSGVTASLKTRYDVITRFEGDLDVIKLLKEQHVYKMDTEKAFQALKQAGKKINFSVIIRFNNRKNTVDEIRSALADIKLLDLKNNPQ